MPPKPSARHLLSIALPLLLGLAACKREPVELAGASSEPAATVRELVDHLQRDDLAGFARAAVPPAQYAVLETAWREDRSRWPLSELPLDDQLAPMLATLSAKGSEQALQRSFERQFAHQDRDLREAARTLGLFGVQYVKNEGDYNPQQRAHYTQVINALSAWAQGAPLGDPTLAKATITQLAAAARKTGLASEADLRAAGMDASLRRLSPFLAAAKASFVRYGLPLDASLADLRTGLVEQKGDHATVRLHYPLGDQEIDSVVSLERRDGRWYLSDYLRQAELALPAPAAAGPASPEAPAGSSGEAPAAASTAPPR